MSRLQSKHKLSPPIITVVDQLWMWVINLGVCSELSLVLTCSPQSPLEINPGLVNSSFKFMHERMAEQGRRPASLDTAYFLAHSIAVSCSTYYLDSSNHLPFEGIHIDPHGVYDSTIRDAVTNCHSMHKLARTF